AYDDDDEVCGERVRTQSIASWYQLSPTKSECQQKTRKKFTGNEPLDPKTMTMQDLIFWNPKNEKRFLEGMQKLRTESETVSDITQLKDGESSPKKTSKSAVNAPQMDKIRHTASSAYLELLDFLLGHYLATAFYNTM
ncbi:unnamed protein product, partial [Gongylonema pulchrum]|uniref:ELM2 domain-containing protein n=1 Tax=Gongylonema pulchrum TaxID=637853 RepID=A0A183D6J8_9BILA